jgi:hypothetical protein
MTGSGIEHDPDAGLRSRRGVVDDGAPSDVRQYIQALDQWLTPQS